MSDAELRAAFEREAEANKPPKWMEVSVAVVAVLLLPVVLFCIGAFAGLATRATHTVKQELDSRFPRHYEVQQINEQYR